MAPCAKMGMTSLDDDDCISLDWAQGPGGPIFRVGVLEGEPLLDESLALCPETFVARLSVSRYT